MYISEEQHADVEEIMKKRTKLKISFQTGSAELEKEKCETKSEQFEIKSETVKIECIPGKIECEHPHKKGQHILKWIWEG